MKTILILLSLAFSHIGFAQLIDPFGKVITHEIKLNKQDDGTFIGAIEWTTGGLDSLQRYIVKGLDVKAPVMVSIISKAPDHNIDLSFHKKNWDKVESKISTDGKKFADKIFRTMSIAGLGVRSKVAGIPYLITVKVGLQFPSTKSLIRITDDKEEYTKHLRKMGYNGAIFEDDNTSSSNSTNPTNTLSGDSNNTLIYVVIGILSIIIILLIVFLFKRKSSKTIMLLLVSIGFSQFVIAQSAVPYNVPITDMRPVFIDYQTQNVVDQVPITYDDPGLRPAMDRTAHVSNDGGKTYQPVRLQPNQGSNELSGEEVEAIQRRMNEDREQFDRDFGTDSPGEETQGNQRTLPTDITNEELNALRTQVQQLQQQVDLLSQEDEEFDRDSDAGGGALLYCEDLEACQGCVNQAIGDFNAHLAYWNYLQKFYLKEVDDLNDRIEYGNTLASMPDFGIAWGPILITVIRPAMNKLKAAYNKKFNIYIESLEADLEDISACYEGPNGRFRTNDSFEIQAYAIINSLKASRINK
jgi:hypothetical protein